MAFGQQSGPPASHRQLTHLKELLQAAGHDDFKTARHEFGLTQRQAAGKFTTGEASDLIDRLTDAEPAEQQAAPDPGVPQRDDRADGRRALLRGIPAEVLADELTTRGWIAMPPP